MQRSASTGGRKTFGFPANVGRAAAPFFTPRMILLSCWGRKLIWLPGLASILMSFHRGAAAEEKTRASATDPDRAFQSAVTHYEAKQYAEAQKELEPLAARLPKNFEVNELMGLVCAAQGQDEKANRFLKNAVRLKPDSAPARTNLAVNLVRLRRDTLAECEFKKAAELEPQSFDANHNLGEFYVRAGKLRAAIPYLKRAQSLDPSSYPNGYDLALAYLETRNLADARRQIQALIQQQDTAELHNLLGEAEEEAGNAVAAVNEYERAAHMEPSEKNIFDWGSELLLHQTIEPAIEIFRRGVERYPRSAKLNIGLGVAFYARGQYDDAVKALSLATDLVATDPRPYLFLAKAYNISNSQTDEVIRRLRRFVDLEPRNARARYYYALALWKGRRGQDLPANLDEIESLLKSAIALEPGFADAHLQLGILYADRRKYPDAIQQYRQAVKLRPDLAEAHYRLGQALVRVREKAQAQEELEVYGRLHKQQVAETENERREIRQFIYTMKESPKARNSKLENRN